VPSSISLLNITIRHVRADQTTALPYSRQNSIAIVFYFRLPRTDIAERELGVIQQGLIKRTLHHNGTFYLPYRHHFSNAQLRAAYPTWDSFVALKHKYDPFGMFTSSWWTRMASLTHVQAKPSSKPSRVDPIPVQQSLPKPLATHETKANNPTSSPPSSWLGGLFRGSSSSAVTPSSSPSTPSSNSINETSSVVASKKEPTPSWQWPPTDVASPSSISASSSSSLSGCGGVTMDAMRVRQRPSSSFVQMFKSNNHDLVTQNKTVYGSTNVCSCAALQYDRFEAFISHVFPIVGNTGAHMIRSLIMSAMIRSPNMTDAAVYQQLLKEWRPAALITKYRLLQIAAQVPTGHTLHHP
jgi:hypothetical protein